MPPGIKQEMRVNTKEILDLAKVDFREIDRVNHAAAEILRVGAAVGALSTATPSQSAAAVAVYRAAKEWVECVRRQLPAMSAADALRVVDAYEAMHRIAFWTPADPSLTARIKLAAFEAMMAGDSRVDQYIMFRLVRKAVRSRESAFMDRPLEWSCDREQQWYAEASMALGSPAPGHPDACAAPEAGAGLTDYDILSRAAILLRSDLRAYEGGRQDEFKRRLFDLTRHYLDRPAPADPRTRRALGQYVDACADYLTDAEFDRVLSLEVGPVA